VWVTNSQRRRSPVEGKSITLDVWEESFLSPHVVFEFTVFKTKRNARFREKKGNRACLFSHSLTPLCV
jgi:hypothetical protein